MVASGPILHLFIHLLLSNILGFVVHCNIHNKIWHSQQAQDYSYTSCEVI